MLSVIPNNGCTIVEWFRGELFAKNHWKVIPTWSKCYVLRLHFVNLYFPFLSIVQWYLFEIEFYEKRLESDGKKGISSSNIAIIVSGNIGISPILYLLYIIIIIKILYLLIVKRIGPRSLPWVIPALTENRSENIEPCLILKKTLEL